jgi:hypothetical protein
MASFGQKHLIKCRCVLPQFKNSPNSQQHRFTVFSEVIDDVVKQKYSQCNNCGLVHKVVDICTSEIMQGKEAMNSILSIDDIKAGMNQNLIGILDRHQCDLPTWEHAQYIMENKRWGDVVVLTSDNEDDGKVIKYVRILGEGIFKIDSHTRKETIGD